jgi:hypothetical protein
MNYKKIYDDLITRAKSEVRLKCNGVYYERHHIIPTCMGGEGNLRSKKEHPNLVLLTAREHFIAHKLLFFIYHDNIKLARAYGAMLTIKSKGRNYRVTSREYAELQEISSKAMSGINNPIHKMEVNPFCEPSFIEKNRLRMVGRVNSEETKKKISIAHIGKKLSDEHKKQIGDSQRGIPRNPESVKKAAESNRGKKRTPEFVRMMSEVRLGIPAPHTSNTNRRMNSQKYICTHCGREIGGRANFVRFHNDNCKLKK